MWQDDNAASVSAAGLESLECLLADVEAPECLTNQKEHWKKSPIELEE